MTNFPLINAVLKEVQEGSIYTFDQFNGRFIQHKSGFSFLEHGQNGSYEEILTFIDKSTEVPNYFHIYDPPIDLYHLVENDVRFNCRYRKRVQLEYLSKLEQTHPILPADFKIESINDDNFECLAGLELNIGDHFWQSKQDFLERGFGSLIMDFNGNGVSVCYSSCVSGGRAEIDIATQKEYQGRGLAKAAGQAFLQQAIQKGVIPNWDCFKENTASLQTALGLGFKPYNDYNFLSIYVKSRA